jgi:nicotinamidase-related amidase
MSDLPLLTPDRCVLALIDQQAGLAFGVGSIDRQVLLNNSVALAKTAQAFGVPTIISTSASKVYSGPLMPAIARRYPEARSSSDAI